MKLGLVLTLLLGLPCSEAFANTPATGPVELTLVLVQEKDACAGGNYLQAGSCASVLYDTAAQWASQRPHITTTLEPGSHAIKLTPLFFEKLRLLVDYDNFPPPDLEGRWSVVLIFDTGDHINTTAVLKRLRSDGVAEATTRLTVGDGGHALTHQRADAFKPARNEVWLFKLDANVYRFWMAKP